jgi:hemoglobin
MPDDHHMTNRPAAHSCAPGGEPDGAAGRQVAAATELVLPAIALPSRRVLDLAGEEKLRQLVRRQYALLMASPILDLYTDNPWAFAKLAEKVADFVVESCGGAAAYSAQNGSTCMRTRHFAVTIDEAARETWLAALFRAMEEVDFPAAVRAEYWNWLEAFSVRLINRRTMKAQPARISFAAAQQRFGGHSGEGLPCGQHSTSAPKPKAER